MQSDKELMQQALKALENSGGLTVRDAIRRVSAIEALRARLAQPEPEPKCVMIVEVFGKDWRLDYMSLPVGKHKLYTHQYNYTAPPQREWQGLTDEEIRNEAKNHVFDESFFSGAVWARGKIMGKNHG